MFAKTWPKPASLQQTRGSPPRHQDRYRRRRLMIRLRLAVCTQTCVDRGSLMWNRREVLCGGALIILLEGTQRCFCLDSNAPHSQGCHLNDSDLKSIYPPGTETQVYLTGNEPIIERSDDRLFDYALAQTLYKISQKFGVTPGFAYYDDSAGHNAYATPRARLANADGTVLMGIGLLAQLRNKGVSPEVAVAGVCAHEFGHIVQYKYGLVDKVDAGQRTTKRSELQADYFAGYFAGLRELEKSSFPASVVVLTMHSFGDVLFGDPSHHGTPQERAAAVNRGFEASFRARKGLSEAIDESTSYVLSL